MSKSIYLRYGKRATDVVLSGFGLLILSPLLVAITACVKLGTHGPVFYRQNRVGRRGRQFQIIKFRSMVLGAQDRGLGITVSGDTRVTGAGRFLRRYKLDELPQLWNVLCGDMSLVGPRPELPLYVERYTQQQALVLSVRPGITDPASLAYRFEEELLSGHQHPEEYYRSQVLPDKLALSLDYVRNVSFKNDLRIILETITSSFLPSSQQENSPLQRG